MKKLISILLVLLLALSFTLVACDRGGDGGDDENKGENEESNVMTYAEYVAAELDSEVVIEAYVQATQSWWSDKITVYAADEDGAYFIYELACSEEDAAKLVPGAKIKVTGYKGAWAGEIEIMDGTFEFVEDETSYVADAEDCTALLGSEDLIDYQNQLVSFNEMTVYSISYKNGEPGDDIYVTLSKGSEKYDFCVEVYLTGTDSDVYKTVGELKVGDVVDVEGFLYWYNGMNPHITSIAKVADVNTKSQGVMTYAEYDEAAIDSEVVIEAYVQATQSWWSDKITVYAADTDGAYFIYELACSEEDAAKLTPGTKIKVSGYKAEWSGEVEVVDATFEFVDDGISYLAAPKDLTEIIDSEELVNYQNQLVAFKGLSVVSVTYKNDGGDDIYVVLADESASYEFCVEVYLTGTESEVYKTVETLAEGDIVNVEAFLYWYSGMNPHITAIEKVVEE